MPHSPTPADGRKPPSGSLPGKVMSLAAPPPPRRTDSVDRGPGPSGTRQPLSVRYIEAMRRPHAQGRDHPLLIAWPNVRIVRDDGQLLRELTLDPGRRYFGAATPVHNVVRQVSSMS